MALIPFMEFLIKMLACNFRSEQKAMEEASACLNLHQDSNVISVVSAPYKALTRSLSSFSYLELRHIASKEFEAPLI